MKSWPSQVLIQATPTANDYLEVKKGTPLSPSAWDNTLSSTNGERGIPFYVVRSAFLNPDPEQVPLLYIAQKFMSSRR